MEFQEGDFCFSSVEISGDTVQRNDFCRSCFQPDMPVEESGHSEESEHSIDEPDLQSDRIFWKTRITAQSSEKKRIVNFESLRDLFFKMHSSKNPAFVSMVYLIGLVLIRKKFLKLVDFTSHDGKDMMRVQRRRGEPAFDVEIPFLDEESITHLKEKLSDLLNADLEGDFDLSLLEKGAGKEGEGDRQ